MSAPFRLPLACALLWALSLTPAAAQSRVAACARPAPAVPSVPGLPDPSSARSLATQPVPLSDAFRPRPEASGRIRPAAPTPPCHVVAVRRGDTSLLESDVYQQFIDGTWSNLSRNLYTYDDADSLASHESQYWESGDWNHDWIESWAYDAEGRVAAHTFTSVFFGVESGWRELFTFDAATGLLTESFYQIFDSGEWLDDGWFVFTYTPEGLVESVTTNFSDGTQWIPFWEETFAYDAEGRLAERTTQAYDAASETWSPLARATWTHEDDARIQFEERWVEDAWQNDYLSTHTLDDAGRTTLFLVQIWEDETWTNVMRQSFAYLTASGPHYTETEVRWWGGQGEEGGQGDVWADGWRELLDYDTQLRIVDYTYFLGVGTDVWESFQHVTFAFDGDHLVEEIHQAGDGAGGWVNQLQIAHLYDDNTGLLTDRLESPWDGTAWALGWRALYAYQATTDAGGEAPLAALDLAIFPNPATEVTIALTLDRTAPVELEVVDVLGRRVARLLSGEVVAGETRIQWQPQGLAPGLYFVRLRAGEQTAVRPVTIVR